MAKKTSVHSFSNYAFYLIGVIIIFVISIFLNHGSLGGDEGKVATLARALIDSNLSTLSFLHDNRFEIALLQNHLAWVLITSCSIFPADNLINILPFSDSTVIWNWLVAYPPAFCAMLSSLIIYKALRNYKIDTLISTITTISLYLLTPISSFLTGGWSECYLLLLIALRVFFCSWKMQDNFLKSIFLALIDAFLIFIKVYAIFFVIIVSPILIKQNSIRNKIVYLISITFFIAIILALKLSMPREFDQNIFGPNFQLPNLQIFLTRLFNSFLSLNFGVFALPPILLLLLNIKDIQKDLYFYFICLAFTITLFFLCLYPFWHGALGVAGQRYISPFILFFAPYVAFSMRLTLKKFPKIIFLIFALILIYIPTLDYRNTLTDVYAEVEFNSAGEGYFAHNNFPTFDLNFHPAIFATTVAIKKNFFPNSEIRVTNKNSYVFILDSKKIIPMTGISRILLIQSGKWMPFGEGKLFFTKVPRFLFFIIIIFIYLTPYLLILYSYKRNQNENFSRFNL